MKNKIYIIGHISPDLDAITSAVTYADYLRKSNRYEQSEIIPLVPGEINNETKFVFNLNKLDIPQNISEVSIEDEDRFILVDHNEESQRSNLIDAEKIIEIVDHHKINLSFTSPVRIDVKPYGSTNSIIYDLAKSHNITLSDTSKNLVLAAILSDTVGLKSSTTTGIDTTIANEIAKDLDIEINDFTFNIFKAKSDISDLTINQIVTKDYKVFNFNNNNVLINQIETVEPQKIIDIKDDIIKELNEVKVQKNVSQGYVVVTDILNINSYVIFETEEEKKIIEKGFTTTSKDNVAQIGPRISRKKDIAPVIEKMQENKNL